MADPVGLSLGFETIGVGAEDGLGSARGLANLPVDGAGARRRCFALIQCAKIVDSDTKGNVAVRWRNDGTAPTADVGMELQPGESVTLSEGLSDLKFIGTGGSPGNAKVNVTYLHWPQQIPPI